MKILIFSNSPMGRWGYSVVCYPTAVALVKAGHEVHYFGMQSVHSPYKDENGVIRVGLRYDYFGRDIIPDYIRANHITTYYTFMDLWVNEAQWMLDLPKMFPKLRWVHHVTIASKPIPPAHIHSFSFPHILVAPSKFNLSELQKCGLGNKSVYIPHATDIEIFKQLSEQEKSEMKKRTKIENKEFVLATAMKNKGMQKGYPSLLYAWKIFLQKNPEALNKAQLLILSDPLSFEGFPIEQGRQCAGTTDTIRFVWTTQHPETGEVMMTCEGDPEGYRHNSNYGFDAVEMSKFYNACDCTISTSQCESFSLPLIESMACGVPVIFNDYSTGPEIVNESKGGICVPHLTTQTTNLVSDIAIMDEHVIADAIEKMYKDKEFRTQCGVNGMKYVRENYTWDKVLPQWVELFKRIDDSRYILNYADGTLGI